MFTAGRLLAATLLASTTLVVAASAVHQPWVGAPSHGPAWFGDQPDEEELPRAPKGPPAAPPPHSPWFAPRREEDVEEAPSPARRDESGVGFFRPRLGRVAEWR
uniref:Pyrokinin-like protein 2 n=1 Tax=Carausius morosus TaxID=7022 RepID=A0A8K1S5M4_CARMO|nr:pyrokinin-like protein 2 [Carausius morosus]